MMRLAPARRVWLVVVLFAVAMAWIESASVYYLRVLVDRIVPYQPNPLPVAGALGAVELVREAATLVMLVTVGILAGATWQQRLGYTSIAFGVWDILYYVFLRVMTGWPTSLLDWDILFLLPLPWWGPVLAPTSIAVLLVVWGTFATQASERAPASAFTPTLWALNGLGMGLALYVFMADAHPHAAAGPRSDHARVADVIQLAAVWPGARPHGCAGRGNCPAFPVPA